MHDERGGVADESIAPVIERIAPLAAARDGGKLAGSGIEAEVAAAQIHGRHVGMLEGFDGAAGVGSSAIDAIVQAPVQVVGDLISVAVKAGENFLAYVGLAVAIGIFEIEDVRGGNDKDAAVPAGDAGGPGDVVGEDGGFFVEAVTVEVF